MRRIEDTVRFWKRWNKCNSNLYKRQDINEEKLLYLLRKVVNTTVLFMISQTMNSNKIYAEMAKFTSKNLDYIQQNH